MALRSGEVSEGRLVRADHVRADERVIVDSFVSADGRPTRIAGGTAIATEHGVEIRPDSYRLGYVRVSVDCERVPLGWRVRGHIDRVEAPEIIPPRRVVEEDDDQADDGRRWDGFLEEIGER